MIGHRNGTKSKELYDYLIDKDAGGRFALLAEANLGGLKLWQGDEDGARAAFDEIIAKHKGHPHLAETVNTIGEFYWNRAFRTQNAGLSEEYQANLRIAMCEWGKVINDLPEAGLYTADACFLSGECHRMLGELPQAIEKYDELFQRWPEFERTAYAQLRSARCLETLARQGGSSKAEHVSALQKACQRVVENYPDSAAAEPAERLLKRWGYSIEEGRQ